jgi:hypothetical protein
MEELAGKFETIHNYCVYFLDNVRYILGRHFVNTNVPNSKDVDFINMLSRLLNIYMLDVKEKYILFSDAIIYPEEKDEEDLFPSSIVTQQRVVEYRFDDINVMSDADSIAVDNAIFQLQEYYIHQSQSKHKIRRNILTTDKPEPHTQILQDRDVVGVGDAVVTEGLWVEGSVMKANMKAVGDTIAQ